MKYFIPAAVLLSFASIASAQVPDGSEWSDGLGTVAHVDVTDTGANGGAGTVTVTDDTGFTPALSATMTANSTTAAPEAQSSLEGTTNSTPGHDYRVKGGKLQKKNSKGKWVDMKRRRKKSNLPGTHGTATAPGDEGSSLPGPGGADPL